MSDWFLNCSCFTPATEEDEFPFEDQPAIDIVDADGKPIHIGTSEPAEEDEEVPTKTEPILETRVAAAPPPQLAPEDQEVPQIVLKKDDTPVPAPAKDEEKDVIEAKETEADMLEKKEDVPPSSNSFKEELKKGIPFKKHCSDRKIRKRMLLLSADGKMIGWKPKQAFTEMIALAEILEVREATTVDPKTVGDAKHPKGMGGTDILRKTCDGFAVAKRAFSFILPKRTLDIEVDTEDEAKRLVKEFRMLIAEAKK